MINNNNENDINENKILRLKFKFFTCGYYVIIIPIFTFLSPSSPLINTKTL